MQVRFTEADGAGFAQTGDRIGVVIGNEIAIDERAGSGADAAGVEEILVGDGDAVQRAAVLADRKFFVALSSFF